MLPASRTRGTSRRSKAPEALCRCRIFLERCFRICTASCLRARPRGAIISTEMDDLLKAELPAQCESGQLQPTGEAAKSDTVRWKEVTTGEVIDHLKREFPDVHDGLLRAVVANLVNALRLRMLSRHKITALQSTVTITTTDGFAIDDLTRTDLLSAIAPVTGISRFALDRMLTCIETYVAEHAARYVVFSPFGRIRVVNRSKCLSDEGTWFDEAQEFLQNSDLPLALRTKAEKICHVATRRHGRRERDRFQFEIIWDYFADRSVVATEE